MQTVDINDSALSNESTRRRRRRRRRRRSAESDAAEVGTEAEARRRPQSRSRSRSRPRSRSSREGSSALARPRSRGIAQFGDSVGAMLKAVDGALRTVERLAWDTRSQVDSALGPFLGDDEGGASGTVKLQRLARTGWMLGQVVASYRFYGFKAAFVSRQEAQRMLERTHQRNAERFYETSATQGGAFLKVGQLLSGRSDFMPEAWINELSKLQDSAPPIGFDVVRGVVEEELGAPLSALFAQFEEKALASASIGQVHRAVTLDGRQVAVKVLRPGVAQLIEADMDLLDKFVEAIKSSLPEIDHETILEELRTSLRAEVDYRQEAAATRAAAEFFAAHTDGSIFAPTVVDGLSTERVMTMDFIDGRNLARELEDLQLLADEGDVEAHARLSSLLGRLLEAYLRQVLQAGVFQADPHPGNLMVAADGRLAILDYGCTKTLSTAQRDRYLGIVRSFLADDRDRVAQLIEDAGFVTRSGRPDTPMAFTEVLLGQVATMIAEGRFEMPDRKQMRREAMALLSALEDDPVISMPSDFVMIARVFGGLGGLMTRHAPDIDVPRHVMPVIGEALAGAS